MISEEDRKWLEVPNQDDKEDDLVARTIENDINF